MVESVNGLFVFLILSASRNFKHNVRTNVKHIDNAIRERYAIIQILFPRYKSHLHLLTLKGLNSYDQISLPEIIQCVMGKLISKFFDGRDAHEVADT